MYPRVDFTFSYWIFGWFILYIFHIIQYNPKIWLILGLFFNLLYLLYLFLIRHYFNKDVILYIIINIFIKVIPIWLLRNSKSNMYDFIFGFFILFLLFLYMFIQLKSFSTIIEYYRYLWNNKNITTPLIYIIHKN
jgi:hypothetical protein